MDTLVFRLRKIAENYRQQNNELSGLLEVTALKIEEQEAEIRRLRDMLAYSMTYD